MELPNARTLEVRRHAKRDEPSLNLSTEGIARERRASACNRSYAHVVTSTLPRAIQTAVAMGHGVDEEDPNISSMGSLIDESIPLDACFADIQKAIRNDRPAALYAEYLGLEWRQRLGQVQPGEAVLIVTHGGIIEAGIIGLLAGIDVSEFGPALGYCEGVRFKFDQDRVIGLRLFRFNDDGEYVDRSITLG